MKDLTEINRERQAFIDEALTNIRKNCVRGVGYTATELSKMSGDLIPPEIFERCLTRGYRTIVKRGDLSYSKYGIFGWLWCRIKEEEATLTYEVYNEDGDLIKTYKKTERLLKAFIVN